LIGVDFDNTLVDYGAVFRDEAVRLGVPVDGDVKTRVRDELRSRPNGELLWQELQAKVYGPGLMQAAIMPGAAEFLAGCVKRGVDLAVVSHKTRFAAQEPNGVDLREAARDWLKRNDIGVPQERIFFEGTRLEKLRRITKLQCTHFVDDLLEVLADPAFPPSTARIWFRQQEMSRPAQIEFAGDWFQIATHVFDRQ
jgi:hypothetical protein